MPQINAAKRPMSAYSGLSKKSRPQSVRSTRSVVPPITRVKLVTMANLVTKYKIQITDQLKRSNTSARDKKTASELNSILKKVGLHFNHTDLRGLLREMGFAISGVSCSFLELIRGC